MMPLSNMLGFNPTMIMKNARLAWSGWLVAALLVMAGWAAQTDDVPPADEAAIDAVYERLIQAYAELDTTMVLDLYTDDAYYLMGRAQRILQGREELGRAYSVLAHAKAKSNRLAIEFRIVDRKIHEDLAYDVGYYKLITTRPDGQFREKASKFLTVLKKQDDGSWRFAADSYSEAMIPAFEKGKLE